MGRSKTSPVRQPNNYSCGPTALKIALTILGIRSNINTLIKLCQTNGNGTLTKHLLRAINKLGLPVLAVEYATLHHMQSALKYKPGHNRAVLVNYLNTPHIDSGHWACVRAYAAATGRIQLLDSYTAKKKSYLWKEFRKQWKDFDLKHQKVTNGERKFRLVRRWQQQLMLVIAKNTKDLPKFRINTARLFEP